MAIAPKDVYPAQTINTDPNYPHGKARNVTVPGDGTGTPFEKDWLNDLWGFLQALLAAAGITPSGAPDHASSSQYLAALNTLYPAESRMDTAEANITSLDTRVDTLEANTVEGPASSVDNELPRFDSTTGKLIQGSDLTIDDSGNLVYKAAKARSIVVPVSEVLIGCVNDAPTWNSNGGTNGQQLNASASATGCTLYLNLGKVLPHGATLTAVRAIVLPALARSAGQGMQLSVWKMTRDFTTPASGSATQLGSTQEALSNSLQALAVTGLSEAIDKATTAYVAKLRSGTTAGADRFDGFRVDFNDPGPRNH